MSALDMDHAAGDRMFSIPAPFMNLSFLSPNVLHCYRSYQPHSFHSGANPFRSSIGLFKTPFAQGLALSSCSSFPVRLFSHPPSTNNERYQTFTTPNKFPNPFNPPFHIPPPPPPQYFITILPTLTFPLLLPPPPPPPPPPPSHPP